MTSLDFARAVWMMRQAQKHYFENRNKGNLAAAKRMEEVVDSMLAKIRGEAQQIKQLELITEQERSQDLAD